MDDRLLREAKREASRSGMTVTEIVEEALRKRLARTANTAGRRNRLRLPTFRGTGLAPGVDLDDFAALLDLMDESK